MDLLRTILVYLTLVFVASVQSAPAPVETPEPSPTPTVEVAGSPTPDFTPMPTPDITPNTAYKTLQVGDRGAGVETMQRRLLELGYYTGEVDGAFGNQTRRSVELFQYYHGLSVDGIAGKRTLTILYESADVLVMPTEPAPTAMPTRTPVPTRTPIPTHTPSPADGTAAPADTVAPAESPDATAPADGASAPAESADALALADGAAAPIKSPAAAPADDAASPTESPDALAIASPAPLTGFALRAEDAIRVGESDKDLTLAVTEGAEAETVRPALDEAGVWYAPLLLTLQGVDVTVIPDMNDDKLEYGFAYGDSLYRISLVIDEEGQPAEVYAYRNEAPIELTCPVARIENGLLYVPAQTLAETLGLTAAYDEAAHCLRIALPTAEEPQP